MPSNTPRVLRREVRTITTQWRNPIDFRERELFHRYIDPHTEYDAEWAARLGPDQCARTYARVLHEDVDRREELWTRFVNAVADHNIRQIETWRDRALAEPLPAYEPRTDILQQAGWTLGDIASHTSRHSIRAPRVDTPGNFIDDDDSVRYQNFLDIANQDADARHYADSGASSPSGNRSAGGSTWSYHSDEFDDIINDARAIDEGARRDNGKDPASDDDADQMPLDADGGCSAADRR